MDIKIEDVAVSIKYNSKVQIKPQPLLIISDDSDLPENTAFNINNYIIEKNNCVCSLENHRGTDYSSPFEGCKNKDECLIQNSNYMSVKSPTSGLLKSKSETCLHSPKKNVTFADACGLDLAAIKQIDLNIADDVETQTMDQPDLLKIYNFEFLFEQPGCKWQFEDVVQRQHICLENCFIDEIKSSLSCISMVNKEDCVRRVYMRYTVDSWLTFNDADCVAVCNEDEPSGRYSCVLDLNEFLKIGIIELNKLQKKQPILGNQLIDIREDPKNKKTEGQTPFFESTFKSYFKESLKDLNEDFEAPDDVIIDNCDINSPASSSNKTFLIEFAICIECNNEQSYWDNNNNLNYKMQCKPKV